MSFVKSSKNKDQLLLDGFCYRQAKNSQIIWRCYKNNCAGRVRLDDTKYFTVKDRSMYLILKKQY